MKKGLTAIWDNDLHGRSILRIKKARGKLTIDEIEDVLRYGNTSSGTQLNGHYVMFLNCSEESCGGNGLGFLGMEDPPGDCVNLYEVWDSNDCPICGKLIPPFEYCPNCGESWKDQANKTE